jgi:hypothetical protein
LEVQRSKLHRRSTSKFDEIYSSASMYLEVLSDFFMKKIEGKDYYWLKKHRSTGKYRNLPVPP